MRMRDNGKECAGTGDRAGAKGRADGAGTARGAQEDEHERPSARFLHYDPNGVQRRL